MSALALTRPPRYKNCVACLYLWPAASMTSGEVRGAWPGVRSGMILLRTPDRHPGPHRSSSRQQARDVDRQRSFCIRAVFSTQAPTLCQRSNDGSDSHLGMLQSIQARALRHGGCPVHSEIANAKGRGDGDPAVRVCNVDPRQGALR